MRRIPVRGALAGGLRLPRLRQQQGVGAAHQGVDLGMRGCGKQTSVTAGTIMHHSKLPLTTWFWAAYLMATHSNGISALQLQRQLALGSYKTAWLLCAKLRRSMVGARPQRARRPGRGRRNQIACRSKHDPVTGGGGRSHQGKMLIVGAVEVQDAGAGPGRIRLAEVSDYSANSLHPFVTQNLAPGATAKTDGWSAYPGAPGVDHDPHVIGKMAAHIVLPWVHRILSHLENMGFGRLSWPAPPASPILPRRVRLPLQPPPHPARRLPLLAWHRRRPPALHLPNVDLTGSRGISLPLRWK